MTKSVRVTREQVEALEQKLQGYNWQKISSHLWHEWVKGNHTGTRHIWVGWYDGIVMYYRIYRRPCPACAGKGTISDTSAARRVCRNCCGTGNILEEKK